MLPTADQVAPADRAKLLRDLADALEARHEDLAQLEARARRRDILVDESVLHTQNLAIFL